MVRVGVLTVSDRCARGEQVDQGGPAVAKAIATQWPRGVTASFVAVVAQAIVPDERDQIAAILRQWADEEVIDLVVTTGGTGFAPRDVTPEATLEVVQRLAPGLTEVMRTASMRVTAHAMLSRAVAGIRGRTLIVNLPGSPKGAVENLVSILPVLPHAIELLQEDPGSEARH